IQVTTDSNTFHSLTVTDLIDPNIIKSTILRKLNLELGHQYLYYHENDAPLTDEELVNICRASDERPKDQISVMLADQLLPPYARDGRGIYPDIPIMYPRATEAHNTYYGHPGSSMHPETYDSQYSPIMSSSPKIIPVTNVHHPRPNNTPEFISSSITASTPSDDFRQDTQQSTSLWAVPPQHAIESSTDLDTSEQPVSLWAVPPQKPLKQEQETTPSSSLWAVPPQKTPEPVKQSSSSSATSDDDTTISSRSPRTPRQRTPLSANSSSGTSPISTSHETSEHDDETWGERPSIEQLYRDIDKYLPGHDLDKEIFIDTSNGAAGAGHKKSIRVVANEAHRNWRQAMNVIRVNHLLRRRSTKMWGRKVEQVKPGMIIEEQSIPKENQDAAPTKMQWVRGELIGRGSFGRVYHALNVAAGEWIAVKEVDAPKTKSDMLNDKMRDAVDSLYREVSLLKDLDHENIVQYLGYDYDEEEGHINIFLEYVPGGSILSVLHKTGRFEEVLVRFFTRQILLGLEYLHDRNIMHRDIKAGNILVDQNGVCKITDFGLSKPSGQEEAYDPNDNTLMKGTVFWMAPEVIRSDYSAKIDIWSLGCTVIEMLSGNHPWLDLNMLAALYNLGKYQAPPLPEDASDAAKDFLNQCFIINPEERPTAADLLVHLFVRQEPSFNFKASAMVACMSVCNDITNMSCIEIHERSGSQTEILKAILLHLIPSSRSLSQSFAPRLFTHPFPYAPTIISLDTYIHIIIRITFSYVDVFLINILRALMATLILS
ncbi:Pkinase-domain-containing protein, partial [Lichtheimia hyalospora FSU 10163]